MYIIYIHMNTNCSMITKQFSIVKSTFFIIKSQVLLHKSQFARSRTLRCAVASDAPRRPRVAVVGAGWGGLGAAKALCENGCEVTLFDGGQPGGKLMAVKPMVTPLVTYLVNYPFWAR